MKRQEALRCGFFLFCIDTVQEYITALVVLVMNEQKNKLAPDNVRSGVCLFFFHSLSIPIGQLGCKDT